MHAGASTAKSAAQGPHRARRGGIGQLALSVFGIALALLLGFQSSVRPFRTGNDPSYIYTYNAAAVEGTRFGTELVSTYGPLGFLLVPLDIGPNLLRSYLFSGLLALALGLWALRFVGTIPELRGAARWVALTAIVYVTAMQFQEWRIFALLLLVLAVGLTGQRERFDFLCAGLLAGFAIMVKWSVGFGALASIVVASCFTLRPRQGAERLLVALPAAGLVAVLLWTGRTGSLGGLVDYVSTGWQISSGYSSAMSLVAPSGWIGVLCFLAFFLVLLLWATWLRRPSAWAVLASSALPLFVAWKHAMVRQDGHVVYLTLFGMIPVAMLLCRSVGSRPPVLANWGFAVTATALLISGSATNPLVTHSVFSSISLPLRGLDGGQALRLFSLDEYREKLRSKSERNLEALRLPSSLRRRIGNERVDVYPSESSIVAANDLNWAHRPLPHSFSAFTPALDRRNAEFLGSEDAPRFLIWHHDVGLRGIDGRSLLHDEPLTLLAILNGYDLASTSPRFSLLERRDDSRMGAPRSVERATLRWGEWTPAPEVEGILLLSVHERPSLYMRGRQLLFRRDPIYMTLRFANAQQLRARVVPENLASGLWIRPLPARGPELAQFLGQGLGRTVTAVRFDAGSAGAASGTLDLEWKSVDLLDSQSWSAQREPTATENARAPDS